MQMPSTQSPGCVAVPWHCESQAHALPGRLPESGEPDASMDESRALSTLASITLASSKGIDASTAEASGAPASMAASGISASRGVASKNAASIGASAPTSSVTLASSIRRISPLAHAPKESAKSTPRSAPFSLRRALSPCELSRSRSEKRHPKDQRKRLPRIAHSF